MKYKCGGITPVQDLPAYFLHVKWWWEDYCCLDVSLSTNSINFCEPSETICRHCVFLSCNFLSLCSFFTLAELILHLFFFFAFYCNLVAALVAVHLSSHCIHLNLRVYLHFLIASLLLWCCYYLFVMLMLYFALTRLLCFYEPFLKDFCCHFGFICQHFYFLQTFSHPVLCWHSFCRFCISRLLFSPSLSNLALPFSSRLCSCISSLLFCGLFFFTTVKIVFVVSLRLKRLETWFMIWPWFCYEWCRNYLNEIQGRTNDKKTTKQSSSHSSTTDSFFFLVTCTSLCLFLLLLILCLVSIISFYLSVFASVVQILSEMSHKIFAIKT